MLKIGICDDEKEVLICMKNILDEYLKYNRILAEVKLFNDLNELSENLDKLSIIFLDIEMVLI